jgi:hypothetical protein
MRNTVHALVSSSIVHANTEEERDGYRVRRFARGCAAS